MKNKNIYILKFDKLNNHNKFALNNKSYDIETLKPTKISIH